MKPLSQMSRKELMSLDDDKIEELWELWKYRCAYVNTPQTPDDCAVALDQLRIQLQQSAAESRHDTQTER